MFTVLCCNYLLFTMQTSNLKSSHHILLFPVHLFFKCSGALHSQIKLIIPSSLVRMVYCNFPSFQIGDFVILSLAIPGTESGVFYLKFICAASFPTFKKKKDMGSKTFYVCCNHNPTQHFSVLFPLPAFLP